MGFRREEFRAWFSTQGVKDTSVASYTSTLGRIDRDFDLDGKLAELGSDGTLKWARNETGGVFARYPSDARSVVKKYIAFHLDDASPDIDADPGRSAEDEGDVSSPLLFQLEREMQGAVRRQLDALEPGLRAIDGGMERAVATGRVDIVAEDVQGTLVVIELKAGRCPSGALEQVLGYADDIADEEKRPVRAILVAGDFSDRTRAAARRVTDLTLRTYEFSVQFNPPTEGS